MYFDAKFYILFVTYVLTTIISYCFRYRIKLEVTDESDSADFMLFDSDAQHLLMKSCKEVLSYVKVMHEYVYPF